MGWKTQFSTVWEWEENRESRKLGRKFSPWAHKFFPPKLGGKARGKTALVQFYGNALPSSFFFLFTWPGNVLLLPFLFFFFTWNVIPSLFFSFFFFLTWNVLLFFFFLFSFFHVTWTFFSSTWPERFFFFSNVTWSNFYIIIIKIII